MSAQERVFGAASRARRARARRPRRAGARGTRLQRVLRRIDGASLRAPLGHGDRDASNGAARSATCACSARRRLERGARLSFARRAGGGCAHRPTTTATPRSSTRRPRARLRPRRALDRAGRDGACASSDRNGATIVTVRAAGLTARVPVTVGFQTKLVSGFDDASLWSSATTARRPAASRSSTTAIRQGDEGRLRLTGSTRRAAPARAQARPLPGQRCARACG